MTELKENTTYLCDSSDSNDSCDSRDSCKQKVFFFNNFFVKKNINETNQNSQKTHKKNIVMI